MRVLIIRLSSMGDLMHALPALTDAGRARSDVRFDWVVDESFAAVPGWHPLVEHTIASAHRRWRAGGGTLQEWRRFRQQLNERSYDAVVDFQGNLKSALMATLRSGPVHGLDRESCREQPAFLAYRHRYPIPRRQHAIERQRQLLARVLGYEMPESSADYGVQLPDGDDCGLAPSRPWLFCAHNASWPTKLWPITHWRQLIKRAADAGLDVLLPCGSAAETRRAIAIGRGLDNARVLPPRLSLDTTATLVRRAAGAVGSDTGFAHLAAMAAVPGVTLYGPTDPRLIGTFGRRQRQLCAPLSCTGCRRSRCRHRAAGTSACMGRITADQVWEQLEQARTQPQRGRPAVFLDRDGVINRDLGYVSRIKDFQLLEPVLEACRRMRALGYALVVITNQSGIGRGLYSDRDYQRLSAWMLERFRAAGAHLDGIYHCPHAPQDNCSCRKPQPGMLLRAAADLDLDLSASVLVGDKGSDMLAGRRAGLHRVFLVGSGQPLSDEAKGQADAVLEDLGALPAQLQSRTPKTVLWYPAAQPRNPQPAP